MKARISTAINASSPLSRPQQVAPLTTGLVLAQSSRISPLKCKWQKSVGEEIQGACPGRSGKFFLLLKDKVVALDQQGEKVGTFEADNPVALGEGREKVYVVSSGRKLKTFDLSGKPVGDQKEFPKWQTNYSYGYEPYNVKCSNPVEDRNGKVWLINFWAEWDEEGLYGESRLLRFSFDDEKVEQHKLNYFSIIPPTLDELGNAYVGDSTLLKISPNFEVKELNATSEQLFLAKDQPYAAAQDKLYHLDFTKEKPDNEDEILHWNNDKRALEPVTGKDGTIHLILRNTNSRKGFYVKINPNSPQNQKVVARREVPFRLESDGIYSHPFLTPGGTLYFFGEKVKVNDKDIYPVYAMDASGSFHATELPQQPFGFYPGKAEEVLIPLKDGKIVSLEAKSVQERLNEERELEMNKETLNLLGQMQGGQDAFARN